MTRLPPDKGGIPLDSTASRQWQRYLIAILAVAAAAAVRSHFLGFLGPRLPFVTFLPAVLGVVLCCGIPAGLLAASLSALAVSYWYDPFAEIFIIRDAADRVLMVVSVSLSLVICCIATLLRLARRRSAEAEAERGLARQRTLDEAKLRESEELYRSLFENTMNAVLLTVPDGTVAAANPAACAMFGRSEAELCSIGLAELVDQTEPRLPAALEQRAGSGHLVCEHNCVRKDGTKFLAEINSVILKDSKRCFVILRDITQRKQAEESLRHSAAELRQAQEIAKLGSWTYDMSGLSWSAQTYSIFGLSPESFDPNAQSFIDLIHPDDRPTMQAWMAACDADAEPDDLEFRIIRPDATVRYVSARGRLICSDYDRQPYLSGTLQDITESKKAEEEKAKLEAQLQQARKMESVGRLAGGVAHDYNNMLSVIIGHANLALMELDPADPLEIHLEEILKAAERSADLTRQLLAFARKQPVAPRVLNLNETVAGMLKMLQRVIGEDVHLSWQPAATLWPVRVDPSQIDQILANLCVNARDSMAGIGRITIKTGNSVIDQECCSRNAGFLAGDYVRLVVADDGCGMDQQTVALIFEPFFTTKGVGEGTGLGLATVYGATRQNNGFIDVGSEPGVGTTFTIYLPRHAGESRQPRRAAAAEPDRTGRETILLVEDETALLELTALALTRHGYRVLAANSPGAAIELAGRHPGEISLLVTDVVMPGMNGRDLATELLSRDPHLSCLFMSGYTSDVIAVHGVLDEGVHFIQKPFPIGELSAKVRTVLDDRQG
ncbi:MAG: hypothetical protein A2075_22820 [Geobacteraceae bacterium GWC2_58_44]|nr:MAG: hypothetical protein A2075_22820 [Geobacteraceae bacterium GWC2_58_44]HBG05146.1 hypothetical protein [Geobacter sp.]